MHWTINKRINKKIILGSAQFGDRYGISKDKNIIKKREAKNILKFSQKNNIICLDTADRYKGSIKILHKQNLKEWKISLKISSETISKLNTKKKFNNFFFKNLKKLNQKKFEYFLFHESQDLLTSKGEKVYEYLTILQKKGFINKIGVSAYSLNEMKKIIKNYKINVVQVPYNIFDQRLKESNLINTLKNMNIELHVRSIFLQGLLLLKKNKIPKKFLKWQDKFNLWYKFLKKNKTTALSECLNFVFSNKDIDKIVIGINSIDHLKEIVLLKKNFVKRNFETFKSKDVNLIDPRKW